MDGESGCVPMGFGIEIYLDMMIVESYDDDRSLND